MSTLPGTELWSYTGERPEGEFIVSALTAAIQVLQMTGSQEVWWAEDLRDRILASLQ